VSTSSSSRLSSFLAPYVTTGRGNEKLMDFFTCLEKIPRRYEKEASNKFIQQRKKKSVCTLDPRECVLDLSSLPSLEDSKDWSGGAERKKHELRAKRSARRMTRTSSGEESGQVLLFDLFLLSFGQQRVRLRKPLTSCSPSRLNSTRKEIQEERLTGQIEKTQEGLIVFLPLV